MSEPNATGRVTTLYDVVIIFLFLLTVVVITIILTEKYSAATDAATLAGVIFPSITAVAAAAFGISQAVRASAAEQKVDKTEKNLSETRQVLYKVRPLLSDVKTGLKAAENRSSVYEKGIEKAAEAGAFDIESLNRKINEIEFLIERIE